jgi:hypothetical protein
MTAAVRRRRSTLAPKVYAFRDYRTGDPLRYHPITDAVVQVGINDIGQEVVLLEKVYHPKNVRISIPLTIYFPSL